MITKEQKLKIFENTVSRIKAKAIDSNKKRLDTREILEEKYRRLQIS